MSFFIIIIIIKKNCNFHEMKQKKKERYLETRRCFFHLFLMPSPTFSSLMPSHPTLFIFGPTPYKKIYINI